MYPLSRILLSTLLLSWLIAGCDQSAPEFLIEIPDKSFLGVLIAQGVDASGDGHISQDETEATRSCVFPPQGLRTFRAWKLSSTSTLFP